MHAFIAMILTQGLAFLVLFLILRKFAFGPVLKMIDARRQHIAAEFDQIEAKKVEMLRAQKEYEQKMARVEDEARIRMRDAILESQKLAEQIRSQAQAEAQEMLRKTRELLENERARAAVQMRHQIVALTLSATEKLIRERLDEAKHRQLIVDFMDSLPAGRT
ncbi:MAG: F0F1 ATP synthase subunit B [Planctomycetes bacterium]|nr:F0F1 ATP synthase subunit B [Planctomycetota bacterium]